MSIAHYFNNILCSCFMLYNYYYYILNCDRDLDMAVLEPHELVNCSVVFNPYDLEPDSQLRRMSSPVSIN